MKMKLVSSLSSDLKFDVGYYHGTKCIWIRNEADLNDLIAMQSCNFVVQWSQSCKDHFQEQKISWQ